MYFFFFSSRRRHTSFDCDWSSDVCSSDLPERDAAEQLALQTYRSVAHVVGGMDQHARALGNVDQAVGVALEPGGERPGDLVDAGRNARQSRCVVPPRAFAAVGLECADAQHTEGPRVGFLYPAKLGTLHFFPSPAACVAEPKSARQ